MIQDNNLKVSSEHPINKGFAKEDKIVPGFEYDHYAIKPGKAAQTVLEDKQGNSVVLAGELGKGRLVYNGTLPGCYAPWNTPEEMKKGELKGKELDLLVNTVKWLANDGKKQD